MITDRELLEGAAKAIGAKRTRFTEDGFFQIHFWPERYEADWEYWDPLTDDGDALRLSAKLEIELSFSYDAGRNVYAGYEAQDDIKYVIEPIKEDTPSATRRAIVRAAYEIGMVKP